MATEEERCAKAKEFQRIDEAFRTGDLDALRAAVNDPTVIPNGRMPDTIGACLVYAIYHSPLSFIRTLLEMGADPNAPVDDGFPPLIAALSCARDVPGSKRRTDVDDICCILARIRTNGASMTARRFTWQWLRVTLLRSKFFSKAVRILNYVRGSTSARRRSKWRQGPA
jgi:Ankyrin repeats (many copies)